MKVATRCPSVREVYLDGLGDVHLVDLQVREPSSSSCHLLKVLVVAVEQVGGVHAHADGALEEEDMRRRT